MCHSNSLYHPISVSEKRLYGHVKHNLYEVDLERKTAFCTGCGYTEIHVPEATKVEKPKIFCIKRYRELRREAKEKRPSSPNRKPRHLLSKIDPEARTAMCSVCGKTDVWKINRGSAYYVCGRYYRTRQRKYARNRYSSKTSKPKAHSLSQIDEETKTAVCSQCGPVTIYMWQGKKKIGRRCANAPVARISGAIEIRRKVNTEIIDAYKAQNGCTRCGFNSSPQGLTIYKKTGPQSPVKIERLLTLNIMQLTQTLEKCEVLCLTCDEKTQVVVLPLSLCPNCFFVAGLQAQDRPTLAACALPDMGGDWTQNPVLSESKGIWFISN